MISARLDLIRQLRPAMLSRLTMRIQDWWSTIGKNYDSNPFRQGMNTWTLLAAATLFAFCVAPTFISYQPYFFRWDDSDYFARSIGVSRAFWAGDLHGALSLMVSHHPPVMTFLGIPWGVLTSWNAAGKCFITLAATISLLVAMSLYLLLRIGVEAPLLVAASACVGASLGPYPAGASARAHMISTGFMADGLFAWITLAAALLIPYEARSSCATVGGGVWRGIVWGGIFSLGAMTKLSFLYFVALILPVLFVIRLYRIGLRSALAALIAFACSSLPFALYLLRWGRFAFEVAKSSSFGVAAGNYYLPLPQFLASTIRASPGLGFSLLLTASALAYVVIKRPLVEVWPDFLPLFIMLGFSVVVLASPNREVRFAFPPIVSLPFLAAILLSRNGHAIRSRFAALATGLVIIGLIAASVPTGSRSYQQSLSRAEVVLAQAARCHAKNLLIVTDSPTLNVFLLNLASVFSGSETSIHSLVWQAMSGGPIQDDFAAMSKSDAVIFQDADRLRPKFTNQRVPEYERYIQRTGPVPIRVGDDISIYSTYCKP